MKSTRIDGVVQYQQSSRTSGAAPSSARRLGFVRAGPDAPADYRPSPGHDPAATAQPGSAPTDTTGNEAGHTPPRHPHPDPANRHAARPTHRPPHRPATTTNQPRDHRTRPQARPHARHRTDHHARDHHQARPTARPRHTTTEPPPRAATARRPNHATTRAGPAGRAHDRETPQERGDGARSTPPRVARFGPGIRLWLFPAARPNTPRAAGCPTRSTGAESDCRSRPDPPSAESPGRLPRASNPAGCGPRPRAGATLRRPAGRTGPQRRRGEGETAKTPTQAPPSGFRKVLDRKIRTASLTVDPPRADSHPRSDGRNQWGWKRRRSRRHSATHQGRPK